jgi:hypothetical protein
MFNIIIGIIFIVGGLSGKLSLIGTSSSPAIVVVGAGLVAWGIYQVLQSRRAA